MADIATQRVVCTMGQQCPLQVSANAIVIHKGLAHAVSLTLHISRVLTSIPAAPMSTLPSAEVHSRKQSAGIQPSAATPSSGLTGGPVRNGDNVTTSRDLVDGVRPQTELGAQGQGLAEKSDFPPKAGVKPELVRKKLNTSGSDKESPSEVLHATVDGTAQGEETALARRLRENGVADLRNTIDTDGDITWAPGTYFFFLSFDLDMYLLLQSCYARSH